MQEFIFEWRIENISFSWHSVGEAIISPFVTAGPLQNSVWTLYLYPRGYINTDYLALDVQRENDSGPRNLPVNVELSCISAENTLLHSHTFPAADTSFAKCETFGHPRFITRAEVFVQRKALYLPRDTLTLRCRLWKNENDVDKSEKKFGFTRLDKDTKSISIGINLEIGNPYIHKVRKKNFLILINLMFDEDSTRVEIKPIKVKNILFSVLKLSFIERTTKKIICEHASSWSGEPIQEIWRLPALYNLLETGNEDSLQNYVDFDSVFSYTTGKVTSMLVTDYASSPRLSEFVSKYIINYIPSGNLSDSPRIFQELWNLYEAQVVCDVELKTQTTSFFVHKFVLCARSSVFLAMLTGDMREKRNERIDIEDITDSVLEKFLLFLYTDSFEDLKWEAVIALYYASDKYHIDRLKFLCCSYLLKNVEIDNVCELLLLADRHQDSDLKKRVDDFILENYEKIFSSPKWKQFADEQPLLLSKTMLLKFDKEREKGISAETYDKKLSKLPNVQDDFIAAYQDGIISDIVLKTASTTFHAHKSVLCASSSTMREMFTHDLKHKPTDIFEMPDLDDGTVTRLLLFLYTDSFGDLQWDTAIKLYHAAGKYQIQRLMFKCSCFLLENIKTPNASDLLLMAHEHRHDRFKSAVEDFIFLHDEEIFGSDQWADFSETNLRLANETMRSKYKKSRNVSHW